MSLKTSSYNKLTKLEHDGLISHKITCTCLSTCSEWKLVSSVFVSKESYSLSLKAKSYHFKKLEKCVLKSCQSIDNTTEITNTTVKELESQYIAKQVGIPSQELYFPIINEDNTFYILESNLGNIDDMENIIFLEFDLINSQNPKEVVKHFTDINSNFVDKEIHFKLNVDRL
jgi:hypothetical protein